MAAKPRESSNLAAILDPQQTLCFERCDTGLAGHRPVKLPLGSLMGVEEAFREMLFLESEESKINAAAEGRIAREKEAAKAKLMLTLPRSTDGGIVLPGAEMTFADRRLELARAIEEFVTPNRAHFVEEGSKQRELQFGRFGWRKTQDSLAPLEGIPKDGNPGLLDQLRDVMRAAVQALGLFACGTLRFFKVDVSIDKRAVLSAAKKDELNGRELRRFGFQIDPGQEKFWCETIAAASGSQASENGSANGQ